MTIDVISTQIESLNASPPAANVATVVAEVTTATPARQVNVHGVQVEYSFVQPNMAVRVHGSQYESLQVELPGPIRSHGSQIEILAGIPQAQTSSTVASMTIEVLRSIPDKKRRPPTNVVAN